jgi:hypothetical protein
LEQLGRVGGLSGNGSSLDAYLDSLVPGITDRARGKTQGASS